MFSYVRTLNFNCKKKDKNKANIFRMHKVLNLHIIGSNVHWRWQLYFYWVQYIHCPWFEYLQFTGYWIWLRPKFRSLRWMIFVYYLISWSRNACRTICHSFAWVKSYLRPKGTIAHLWCFLLNIFKFITYFFLSFIQIIETRLFVLIAFNIRLNIDLLVSHVFKSFQRTIQIRTLL